MLFSLYHLHGAHLYCNKPTLSYYLLTLKVTTTYILVRFIRKIFLISLSTHEPRLLYAMKWL